MNEHACPADGSIGFSASRGRDDSRPIEPLSLPLQAVVWLFLVTLAVVGRAWQPAAHVTPLAAVALAAGVFFPSTIVAASVPVAALAIGNLFLGRAGLLGGVGRGTRWLNVVGGALASSLVFYFATNIAHWLLTDMYPRTASGLAACLVAALPFHRWMPVGDVVWSLAVFALLAGVVVTGDALATRRLTPARVA